MQVLFAVLALSHIFIWVFVLTTFVHRKTARLNLYYVIPFIYVIHCLPIHLLEQLKLRLSRNAQDKQRKQERIEKMLVIPHAFVRFQKSLEARCTFSPISPQGMLLFGMITCLFRVHPLR